MDFHDYPQVMQGNFLLFEDSSVVPAGVYIVHCQADTDVWDIENTETLEKFFVTKEDIIRHAVGY